MSNIATVSRAILVIKMRFRGIKSVRIQKYDNFWHFSDFFNENAFFKDPILRNIVTELTPQTGGDI